MSGFKIDLKSLKDKHGQTPEKEVEKAKTNSIEKTDEKILKQEDKVAEKKIENVTDKPKQKEETSMKQTNSLPEKEKLENIIPLEKNEDNETLINNKEKEKTAISDDTTNTLKKSIKINLKGIKSVNDKKIENKKQEEILKKEKEQSNNIENEQKIEKQKEVFTKYQSDFKRNSHIVLEKIKKLKNLPKTRVGFLILISLITITGISLISYLAPQNHPIKVYGGKIQVLVFEKLGIPIDKKEDININKNSNNTKSIDKGVNDIEINKEVPISDTGGTTISKEKQREIQYKKEIKKKLSDFLKNNSN